MKRDTVLYLEDILVQIDTILEFIQNTSKEIFLTDKKENYAVVRAIEIIGEAASRASTELEDKYPELPWHRMKGMRNIIVHEYFDVDLGIIWEVATKELLPLKTQISAVIDEESRS
ncbi:MAG: DUF86 domain-containing protein [bacterium]|nr:DUF86 domain-containing protein [bacterium]